MYVCICAAVSDRQIREAVRGGARCLGDVTAELGVGAGCGCCREMAAEIIETAVAPAPMVVREVARLAAHA